MRKAGSLMPRASWRTGDIARIHAAICHSWLSVPGRERPLRRIPAALSRLKPYTFHIALAVYWPILLYADTRAQILAQQHALGVLTFAFLFLATRFSPQDERRQVWLMVGVATSIELFCSVVWGLYRLMVNHGRLVKRVALGCATVWTISGFTAVPFFVERLDVLGALLWPAFVWFLRRPSAMVYAASFFVTAELELLGTGLGNWAWAVAAPVIHLPAANPPSVIAGGYCVLDAAASKAASFLPAAGAFSRWLSSLSLGRLNLVLCRRR
jgi:hypothetical protein